MVPEYAMPTLFCCLFEGAPFGKLRKGGQPNYWKGGILRDPNGVVLPLGGLVLFLRGWLVERNQQDIKNPQQHACSLPAKLRNDSSFPTRICKANISGVVLGYQSCDTENFTQ